MTDPFPPNSRYAGLGSVTHERRDGSKATFLERRIIPAVSRFRAHDRVRADAKDRVDTIAHEAFGDAELYWRITDANGDADPSQTAKPAGRLLVIPLPLEVADDGDA